MNSSSQMNMLRNVVAMSATLMLLVLNIKNPWYHSKTSIIHSKLSTVLSTSPSLKDTSTLQINSWKLTTPSPSVLILQFISSQLNLIILKFKALLRRKNKLRNNMKRQKAKANKQS